MRFVVFVLGMLAAVACWMYFSVEIKRLVNIRSNFGTLDGVDGCVTGVATALVQSKSKRDFCANLFQIETYEVDVRGVAGPDFSSARKTFSGTVRNEGVEWVITQVNFKIEVGEADKKESVEVYERVWIEPDSESSVSMDLDSLTESAWDKWRKCSLEEEAAECFSWGVVGQYGVRFK